VRLSAVQKRVRQRTVSGVNFQKPFRFTRQYMFAANDTTPRIMQFNSFEFIDLLMAARTACRCFATGALWDGHLGLASEADACRCSATGDK
jgi:hypothetical protein